MYSSFEEVSSLFLHLKKKIAKLLENKDLLEAAINAAGGVRGLASRLRKSPKTIYGYRRRGMNQDVQARLLTLLGIADEAVAPSLPPASVRVREPVVFPPAEEREMPLHLIAKIIHLRKSEEDVDKMEAIAKILRVLLPWDSEVIRKKEDEAVDELRKMLKRMRRTKGGHRA